MGYLDNSTIVVDAVLTKEGRRRLANGQGLDIRFFSLSDSGIDYRLWNPDHPSGSAYYGEAIENLPSLEAIPRAEFYMRNKLITLNQDVTGLPYWDLNDNTTVTLNDTTDASPSYEGINVDFDFKEATISRALLIVHDGTAVPSSNLISPSLNSTNIVTGLDDVDGTTYQALINTESDNAQYFDITSITNSRVSLNFKRAEQYPGNSTVITTCTIIDPASGIYATFNLNVTPKA